MSAAFDTLDAARQLEDAGMDRRHAEAVATVVRKGQGELATKDDIRNVNDRITSVLNELVIHRWVIGIVAATSMATLAVLLTHTL